MLRELFPSWLEIRKYEEVVTFVCGLMKDPKPLVDHIYESYIAWTLDVATSNPSDEETERQLESQGKMADDLSLFKALYAESTVALPGSPLHNQHINHYDNQKDDAKGRLRDVADIYIPSKLYEFHCLREDVECGIVNTEQEMPECAMRFSVPHEEVAGKLLLNCCRISLSQPVCHLRMYNFACKPLAGDVTLSMSKNIQSLYLNRSFLSKNVLRNILRQLINDCTALQWVQLRWIDLYDVEEDLAKLLRVLVAHHDRKENPSLNAMYLRVELRHNNLSKKFETEMKKLWRPRRTRMMSFHCSQYKSLPRH